MDAARAIREADSKCEYGLITVGEYERIIAPFRDVEPVVRCKNCVRRGNPRECIIAKLTDKTNTPYFVIDNRGEWFCADGKKE